MNEWDMLGQIMTQVAKQYVGGKVVYSQGRICFKCGKPCADADKRCLAKGYEVFACKNCEPIVF